MYLSLLFSKKLRQTVIKEFGNELKSLKTVLNEIKNLELSREQKINEAERKLNMLDEKISDILETLDANLTTLELRCRFCGKPHNFEEERKLILSANEKINEIETLKENVKNKEDELLNDQVKLKFLN